MPITIPQFVQYQGTLFPLRGLWDAPPAEGDRFVNVEIDWGSPGLLGVSCVQFQLSGNSPVAFSQIVAMSVDNSRCGSDVDFIFPDSGFVLTVPAFNQGVYPVFTNALMFYANAPLAEPGDITITQILNSLPPPIAIQPSSEQQQAGITAVSLTTNSTTSIIPPPTSGTVNGFSIVIGGVTAAVTGACTLQLSDGTPKALWIGEISAGDTGPFTLSGLHLRFANGLNLLVSSTSLSAGAVFVNVYISVP